MTNKYIVTTKEAMLSLLFMAVAIGVVNDVSHKLDVAKALNAETATLIAEHRESKKQVREATVVKVRDLLNNGFSTSAADRAALVCGSVLFNEIDASGL